MARYDHDLFVIGGGSGGVRAGRIAAGHGARVAIAEQSRYGGTCVIRGCIPKKLLVYAAHFHEDFADAAGYGWQVGEPRFSWPDLIAAKDKEIARLEAIYRKLLVDAGAKVLDGRATLADAHTVVVDGRRSTAATILVATGGRAVKPAIPGAEFAITSDEAFHLDQLPRRIIVLGGGYIACEFAGIFNGLGAEVTLAYRGEALLRGFDGDVRRHLGEEIERKGVRLVFGSALDRIERRGAELAVVLADGREIVADAVLAATGRDPNTAGLGLEAAGVKLDQDGAVAVDEWSRSSAAHIYAVGDVTNRVNLTPVAIKEGHAFADTLYGGRMAKADHRNVAHAVFSQPGVASVGLSEEDARREGGNIKIFRSRFRPLKHTLSGRQEFTLVKLVVDAASDRVLGAHMVGAEAAEIIQGLAIAIKCGARKADFDSTVGIHPTAAEEFVTLREAQPSAVRAEAAPKIKA